MYPVSATFRAAVRASHTAISRAEIWSNGTLILTLPFNGGSVKVDSKSTQRRKVSALLNVPRGSSIVPSSAQDAVQPFGNELRVWRGVVYSDGSIEWAPLGIFDMTNTKFIDGAAGVSVEIDGADRSSIVSNNKWTQPYQMAAGLLTDALTAAILDRNPDAVINIPASVPVLIKQQVLGSSSGGDPWADLVGIAQLAGYDLFVDPLGQFTIQALPTIDSLTVDVSYVEGVGNTVTDVERDDDTFQTYNGVIYVGSGSNITVPIRVE